MDAKDDSLAELQRRAEQFLYREARLLDEEDYDGWLALMAPDIHYWVPTIENRFRNDPLGSYGPDRLSHFDDDLGDLRRRITRFKADTCWSESPPTRQLHLVANVEVEQGGEAGEVPRELPRELVVHSVLAICRNRGETDEEMLYGRRRDVIRITGDGWKLAKRRVVLTQNVLLSKNINTFF